jgi:alpha-tubulin suppressor-like RCC1 family protein
MNNNNIKSKKNSKDLFTEFTTAPAIACGGYHSMLLESNGTVKAWGLNNYGQCNVPDSLSNVTAISCGHEFSAALKSDGTVVTWGLTVDNPDQLPDNTNDAIDIACGWQHLLILKMDGTVVARGYSTTAETTVPSFLQNSVGIAVCATNYTSAVLLNTYDIVIWGQNLAKPNSNSFHNSIAGPAGSNTIKWTGPFNFMSVGNSIQGIIAVDTSNYIISTGIYPSNILILPETYMKGGVYCPKTDAKGNTMPPQLQTSKILTSSKCYIVNNSERSPEIVSMANGYTHCMVLGDNGIITAWGSNTYDESTVPVALPKIKAIACGYSHSMALTINGEIFLWGSNTYNQCTKPNNLNIIPFSNNKALLDPSKVTTSNITSSSISQNVNTNLLIYIIVGILIFIVICIITIYFIVTSI